MPVTYAASTKSARMQAVADDIGNGGTLEIGSAGFAAVLASIPLASPPGIVTGDVLTLTVMEDQDANATGIAAAARIKNSSGAVKVSGLTVGIAGAEPAPNVVMNSVDIQEHAAVAITAFSITHF